MTAKAIKRTNSLMTRLMPLRSFSRLKLKLVSKRANTGVNLIPQIKRCGRKDSFWKQKAKTPSGRPFIATTLRRIRKMLSE